MITKQISRRGGLRSAYLRRMCEVSMKTKTEAAKVLLENGWTYEEVELVLGQKIVVSSSSQTTFCHKYPPIVICGKEIREFDGIKRTKLMLRDVT